MRLSLSVPFLLIALLPSWAAAQAAAAACPAVLQHTQPRLQDEKPVDLCGFAGQVVLVVNTASQYGYSTDLGTPFKASTTAVSGLTAVHRLWNATTIDFTEALDGSAAFTKAKAAGCAGYMVSFLGKRVVYFGRTAEVHVEHFPK
mgnify:CR=1 FL=1